MAAERRSYTEEFKREAVQLLESSGKPVAQLARDLGVNDNNLYRWRELYGNQPQTGTKNDNPVDMAAELKRLRQEVAVLRQERDILKKAMHIIGRSQP
jgi:transposase